jgi:hypothetical protein
MNVDATAADVLRGALALIPTSDQWTRGTMARDGDGNPTEWWSATAQRFCSTGAIYRAASTASVSARTEAMRSVAEQINPSLGRRTKLTLAAATVFMSNDSSWASYEDVRLWFKRAIEACE